MKYLQSRFRQFLTDGYRSTRAAMLLAAALLFVGTVIAQTDPDDPDDAVAIFNQAQELHEKGDLKAAIDLYKKAIKIFPEFPEAEYQCGVAYLALGNVADAEHAFRRAVELRADWTLAMTSLGSLLVQNGKFTEADTILTRATELDTQNFPAYAAMAELRLKIKASPPLLQELLTKIVQATGKAKPTASLWTARAALENALGKRDAAKVSLATALSLDPKNKFALTETADIALSEGDVVGANDATSSLEKIAPDAASTKILRARVLVADGKTSEALKILDAIGTDSAEAADLRKRLTASGSENAADLEKLLETDPNNGTVLGRLCSLDRVSAPDKALEYCRRASEAEPNNINHAVGYGAALVQSKQYEQAVALFNKILAIAPDNGTAHANRATALFQLKRFADAKTEYRWLVAKQPDLAAAYYFLGITHDQLAEYLDAMANYQQFLRRADPAKSQLEIDKVNLRIPALQRLIKESKGKKVG